MKRVVVLISGRGSNLEALIEARLPVQLVAVVSNRPDAAGLSAARAHGIATHVIDHHSFASRADFDAALATQVDVLAPDLVVLAGFMRVLDATFVNRYRGHMINIHPSLLPSFPGIKTHAQALAAGVRVHGCTVHFVTAELDHGPIIAQAAVPVMDDDTPETLSARVLEAEHRLYPDVVRWIAEDRVSIDADNRVRVAGASALQRARLAA